MLLQFVQLHFACYFSQELLVMVLLLWVTPPLPPLFQESMKYPANNSDSYLEGLVFS